MHLKYSDSEVIHEAMTFIRTPGGVSATAELLQIPRSTVHYHIAKRLRDINPSLWFEVRKTIAYNKHNKGGKKHEIQ